MRIALYIANNGWMATAFKNALENAGVSYDVFFYGNQYSRRYFTVEENAVVEQVNQQFTKQILKAHSKLPYHLIFFCACDDYILPSTLVALKRLSIPLVNYQPDMGFLWFRLLRTGKYFDLVACAQTTYISALRKRGINARFVPFGANPSAKQGSANHPFFKGIRYLGSPFPDRAKILGQLYAKGLPLEVYGHHWFWFPRDNNASTELKVVQNGFSIPFISTRALYNMYHYLLPRFREEPAMLAFLAKKQLRDYLFKKPFAVEAFYGHIPPACIHGKYDVENFDDLVGAAAINIGFLHMHALNEMPNPCWQMRLRDMEIPMAGGFYLAEYSDDLIQCFEPGKHIAIWQTVNELADKAAYYLAHPAKTRQIALAGMRHAQAHHTWVHRFNQIFQLLGL